MSRQFLFGYYLGWHIIGFPSPPPQQPQLPLPSIIPEQQLDFLSPAWDCSFILAQHGQDDIDMPSFMLCPPVGAAIVDAQADKARVARTARSGRDARRLSTAM